jgi:hypothetical protein
MSSTRKRCLDEPGHLAVRMPQTPPVRPRTSLSIVARADIVAAVDSTGAGGRRPRWAVAWLAKDEASIGAECLSGERRCAVGSEEGHRGRGVGGGQPALEGLPVDGSVELDVGVDRA